MFSTFLALALVAQEQPAQPTSQEQEPAVEEVQEQKVQDERICRRVNTGMGSRRKEKVCLTREEWREFNRGN